MSYTDQINQLVGLGALDRAVEQMRIASKLDPDNAYQVLPVLARLARRAGDTESERFALLRLLAARPDDVELSERLEEIADPPDSRSGVAR